MKICLVNSDCTLGDPFAYPGINITRPFSYLRGNVHFDWFNQYLCTGEHFQSDLDIFQFDFMFVKPHDVTPLLCFNVQTEMRFWVEQLLLTMPTLWKQELFYSKSRFTNIKWNWNMSRSDWKCSLIHKYWLNRSKWTFSTQITEGAHNVYPRVGEWVTQCVFVGTTVSIVTAMSWFV